MAGRVDLTLRFAYVVLVPAGLVSLAMLVPVTALVLTAALATTVALIGTEAWRRKVGGVPVLGKFLGNMARVGEYYADNPPKPLIYYIAYPLLFPYWLIKRKARQEFLLYRRISAIVLLLAAIHGAHTYLTRWQPDIPFKRFAGTVLGGVFIQLMVTFSVVMPVVTTVITYHRRGLRRLLAVMLVLGLAAGGGVYALIRNYPFTSFELRQRIIERSRARPQEARAAMLQALGAANQSFQRSHSPDIALAAAHLALGALYRDDEAAAFDVFADGAGQLLIEARFDTSAAPVYLVIDRAGIIDDPARWSAKTHAAIGR